MMDKSADISECGCYRYLLTRTWDQEKPSCLFIMLNPSTADADVDDPTIRRCVGFARAWGCGELRVVNLYALRATDPSTLRLHDDPVGPLNDYVIAKEANRAERVICAWGVQGLNRSIPVLRLLRGANAKPMVLRLTKLGHPAHPLYLPKSLEPQPWT